MAPVRVSRLMGKSAARTTFCAAPSAGRARISEGTIRCDVYNLRRAAIGAEVEGVGVAQGIQLFAGRGAAHAALAVEQQNLTLVLHAAWETGFNPVQGEIDGAGKMALVELGRGSDIDNQGAAFQVRCASLSEIWLRRVSRNKTTKTARGTRMVVQFIVLRVRLPGQRAPAGWCGVPEVCAKATRKQKQILHSPPPN